MEVLTINIAICDDEMVYRQSIRKKIDNWSNLHRHSSAIVVREFRSSEDLLNEWEKGMPLDLLYIDIQIPGEMSGLDVAKHIYMKNSHLPIVFITNYSEYACEGYRVNALRYIRKPVNQSDIDECMDIVWRRLALCNSNGLLIYAAKQTLRLPINTILSIESIGHMVRISTIDEIGHYVIKSKIEPLLKQLPPNMFTQCHRSYIVNLMYVRKFQNANITLTDGTIIPIGKKYARLFVDKFRLYYQGVG